MEVPRPPAKMLRPGPDRGENGIFLLCGRRKPQRCRSRDQRADLRRPGWLGCPAERRTRPGMLRNPMKSWPAGRCGGAKSMPRETRGRAWECLGDAWGTGRERRGGAEKRRGCPAGRCSWVTFSQFRVGPALRFFLTVAAFCRPVKKEHPAATRDSMGWPPSWRERHILNQGAPSNPKKPFSG